MDGSTLKKLVPHSARIAACLGALSFLSFAVWLYNTRLFYGHYETDWGPGWIIGISALSCISGTAIAVVAAIQKISWKRMLLLLLFILLSIPVIFLALAQLSEVDNAIGEWAESTLEQLSRRFR